MITEFWEEAVRILHGKHCRTSGHEVVIKATRTGYFKIYARDIALGSPFRLVKHQTTAAYLKQCRELSEWWRIARKWNEIADGAHELFGKWPITVEREQEILEEMTAKLNRTVNQIERFVERVNAIKPIRSNGWMFIKRTSTGRITDLVWCTTFIKNTGEVVKLHGKAAYGLIKRALVISGSPRYIEILKNMEAKRGMYVTKVRELYKWVNSWKRLNAKAEQLYIATVELLEKENA